MPLLDDLPGHGTALAPVARPGALARPGPVHRDHGHLRRRHQEGSLARPEPVTDRDVFGGAELDLREAVLPGPGGHLTVTCVFGGCRITVPPEMRVIDSGVAVLGGRDIAGDSPESRRPDAPVLRVSGTCVFGGLEVKRKRRKDGKGRRWPTIRIESS